MFLQDYTQQPPAQELIARDLHDNEWKFRHIFRGKYGLFRRLFLICCYSVIYVYWYEQYLCHIFLPFNILDLFFAL